MLPSDKDELVVLLPDPLIVLFGLVVEDSLHSHEYPDKPLGPLSLQDQLISIVLSADHVLKLWLQLIILGIFGSVPSI